MSDDSKKNQKDTAVLGVDRPRVSRVEEHLLQGNWKVMYTIAKDGTGDSSGDGDGDGGSGGSNSGSSDSGSSGNCSPA